ncbi:MAG: hypothetical protein PHH54_07305 [Candidatus Nanoarchaeia archaeon]|nr:hypothetical protein [Candidatus Nanoarchaeia archaeon]MDD5741762.1 hypothetical protein [Candidatus Nanoarchaeia archaeon]
MKLITKLGTGALKQETRNSVLEQLAKDAYELTQNGDKIIVVTSGAVGLGKAKLKINENEDIAARQAYAAVGQPILMQEYISTFNRYSLNVAQFLLAYSDLDSISRIENIKHAYEHLRKNKIIPIVNENDVTATEELTFGDNDTLATQIAIMMGFNTIINYTERGALVRYGETITLTSNFNTSYYDTLDNPETGFGRLSSKLEAAKKAVQADKRYHIAKAGDSIFDILSGEKPSTRFLPEPKRISQLTL